MIEPFGNTSVLSFEMLFDKKTKTDKNKIMFEKIEKKLFFLDADVFIISVILTNFQLIKIKELVSYKLLTL